MADIRCDSCGLPMEAAADHALGDVANPYCTYCAPDGELPPFEERFDEMVGFIMRTEGLDRDTAEAQAREHMREMPAWRGHPALA